VSVASGVSSVARAKGEPVGNCSTWRVMPNRLPNIGRIGKRPKPIEDRPSPSARGYDRNWRKIREAALSREPLCRACASRGGIVEATDVDHVIARSNGGTNDDSNLMSLCHECHSQKTVAIDGGLGRAKRR
jgi:5-methylcytosine-specific restriction protein A